MTSRKANINKEKNSSKHYHDLIENIFELYTTKHSTRQNDILTSYYESNATFEDPFVVVEGINNIATQFHSLIPLINSIQVHRKESIPIRFKSTSTDSGHGHRDENIREIIIIPNVQIYKIEHKWWPFPKEIVIEGETHLSISMSSSSSSSPFGKIIYHHDIWINHPFTNSIKIFKKMTGFIMNFIFHFFKLGEE